MTSSLNQPKTNKPRKTRLLGNLILWLLLVPIVFGTLILFSELALVIDLEDLAADTRSLLQAQYKPWPYDEIPPINIAALISDIQKEIEQLGTPVVTPIIQEGEFLVPPDAQITDNVQSTPEPVTPVPANTATDELIANTPTKATPSPSATPKTATPPATRTSSPTNTIQVIFPTFTYTPEPEDTKPPPTSTKTLTPSPTQTFTLTVAPTLEYAPVRPIAENNGESIVDPEGQGCLAYFGYRNDNPVEIDIPIGERNYLSETPVRIAPDPEQPTHFYTDRVSPAFEVVWNNAVPFVWYLDGREAVVQWCNP